ncbi:MAG: STN domain-containing protein [Phycisphaerae bacterium]|jgi:hypothetical protein
MRWFRQSCPRNSWVVAVLGTLLVVEAARGQHVSDWDAIWRHPLPESRAVKVTTVPELGSGIENREWQMIATRYHEVHYQPTTNPDKVAEVCALIDNLYDFLAGRSPAKPETPIRTFIIPDEWASSRCSRAANAMRTGDQADVPFILASLLHEETHLFNFAFLKDKPQGWWAGEYFCLYFQQRALWLAQGKDFRKEALTRLPDGPGCGLAEIQARGKRAFDEAVAALYFFEEQFGREKIDAFRRACLRESLKTGGGPLPDAVFAEVFGHPVAQLDERWRVFYGGADTATPAEPEASRDPRLSKPVSYTTDKASVQNVVQELARQVGLGYDFGTSRRQTAPLCTRWLKNLRIENQPLHEALHQILDPLGLTYRLDGDAIVLRKK